MSNTTSDIDDHFFDYLQEIADDVVCRPRDLMAVMFSESGVRHDAWNNNPQSLPPEKRYNASGISQMMPATLVGLGFGGGHAAFRALSATDQLTWVERYFRPHRGKLVSIGAIYTANFLPVYVDRAKDPSFVLTAKNGVNGWAFSPNATFDTNGDLMITVGELESAVLRNCSGPRWAELVARLSGDVVSPVLEHFDLGTVQGMQAALDRLGYDLGTVDGIPGPKTRAALYQFQAQHDLAADGIYGPKTRATLQTALDTAQ